MRFIDFVIKDPLHKRYLLIALAGSVMEFVIFKLLYPFADFFSDSDMYIYGAYANLDINILPIGYSKFLRLFHFITHSDTVLVAFQYFFLVLTCLYFFFTVLYFYNPSKYGRVILFVFLFFYPLSLYISNYVNSDPLFGALSVWWFTELIWIVQRPKLYHIFTQAILLFLVFTVRHNAMYYPLIGTLAFMLSRQQVWRKLAGTLLGGLSVLFFVIHEQNAAYKLYGVYHFSPMRGWQLANNALYMYGRIQVNITKLPTEETKDLDTMAKNFYRKWGSDFDKFLSSYIGNFFMRQPEAPLHKYLFHHYKLDGKKSAIIAWGKCSVIFGDYGSWLLKHFPLEYARYFLLLNARNYLLPPLENLKVYNLGNNTLDPIAKEWFDYKSLDVTSISNNLQSTLLFIFPILFTLFNFYSIGGILLLLLRQKFKQIDTSHKKTILLSSSFLITNMLFCIFTTIIVFSYEFFPMIVCLMLSIVIFELLTKNEAAGTCKKYKNIKRGKTLIAKSLNFIT